MSQDVPAAKVGDPLPHLMLPNAAGDGMNLGHQSQAGRWQVLIFLSPMDVAARMDAIAAARGRMAKFESACYVIGLCEPDPSLAGADMFDESGKATEFLLGSATPGIAVITPDGRLGAQFADLELDTAIMHCEARASAQTTGVIKFFAPVLVLEDVLEPDLCRRIISFWDRNPKSIGSVASTTHGNDAEINAIKRRQDVVIPDGAFFEEIKQTIARRVLPQIGRAFQMQIASMEALRVGQYSAEDAGAFGRHRDNATPYTAHRRLALTLNLNTGEYEGGELRFPEFGPGLYQPPAGGGVVFSCGLLHEALPVTRGNRYGMFTFLTDAAGFEQEKAMHERVKQETANQAS